MSRPDPEDGAGEQELQPERNRRASRHALKIGCLGVSLLLCSGMAIIGAALQGGPVQLGVPGGTAVKLGSDNFVLSNYSFQDGTTYYLDTGGNGVRNILEFRRIVGGHSLDVVLHHADRLSEGDQQLFSIPLP